MRHKSMLWGSVILLAGLALPSALDAQAKRTQPPIVLEVTWTYNFKGPDWSGQRVLVGRYELTDPYRYGLDLAGLKDGQHFGFELKYLKGDVVRAEAFIGGKKVVEWRYVGSGRSSLYNPPGWIRSLADGSIGLYLNETPALELVDPEMQSHAQYVLGCGGGAGFITREKITYDELRNILQKPIERRGSAALDPDFPPECETTSSVVIRAAGRSEEAKVALSGCTDLAVGESSVVTALGEPVGGTFRYWAEPAAPLSVAPAGDSATLRGKAPGKTTLHVEYTAPGGETAKDSRPGSCVKLVSVNNGASLPKLGLYDAKAQRRSPVRTVPLQAEPGGELLSFPAAQPIVTVVNQGNSLQLQGTQEGKTTVQAQTKCGEKTGPVLAVEVVPCDDEVIAQLKAEFDSLRNNLQSNSDQARETLSDRRLKEAEEAITSPNPGKSGSPLAWSLAVGQVIADIFGAGAVKAEGKATETALKKFDAFSSMVGSVGNAVDNALSGSTETRMKPEDYPGAADPFLTWWDVMGGNSVSAGFAFVNDAIQAGQESIAFAENLGAVEFAAERLTELEQQHRETLFKYQVIGKRLYGICKYGQEEGKSEQEAKESQQPSEQKPAEPPETSQQPGEGQETPPERSESTPEGSKPEPKPEPGRGPGEPPPPPPPQQPGRVGLPLPSGEGCGQKGLLFDLQQPAGLRSFASEIDKFRTGPVSQVQQTLAKWETLLQRLDAAAKMSPDKRRTELVAIRSEPDKLMKEAEEFGAAGQEILDLVEGCRKPLAEAVPKLLQPPKSE